MTYAIIAGMHSRYPAGLPAEVAEFADEIRQVFLELGRAFGLSGHAGQCSPAIDVYERETRVEIVVDVPGVDPQSLRVMAKGVTILIVGEKAARRPRAEASFHLVERDFGRFARAVRVSQACDMSQARARLADGELHIFLPKIAERRGRTVPITVQAGEAG
jgi:HSP20 family protein